MRTSWREFLAGVGAAAACAAGVPRWGWAQARPGVPADPIKMGVLAIRAGIAAPGPFTALDGTAYEAGQADLVARVMSMGNCHRAFALTAAMCLAVAARIPGTVVHEASAAPEDAHVRLGHPSGILPIAAAVSSRAGEPWAERVTVYRSARRLMEGFVRIP